MIYILSHTNSPLYELSCPHKIINTTECKDLDDSFKEIRGLKLIIDNEDLSQYEEIGFFQNRRRLSIDHIPDGYDCVVSKYDECLYSCRMSILDQYSKVHIKRDLEILADIVGDDFAKYISNQVKIHWHTMTIMKRDNFIDYARFLLSNLIEWRKNPLSSREEGYQKYAPAYLGERLGSYWFSKLKCYEADIITFNY